MGSSVSGEEDDDFRHLVEAGILTKKKMSSLDHHISSLPAAVAAKFKELICYWVIECAGTMSFNCVTHPAFKEALQCIGIKSGMDRKYLAGDFLTDAFKKAEEEMKEMLDESEYYQLAVDAWKRKAVNDGLKIVGACLNLPSGNSVFGDFVATDGVPQDAKFLDQLYTKFIMQFGDKACLGVVLDGESANLSVAKLLEAKFPWTVCFWCQVSNIVLTSTTFQHLNRF